jgi:hypothetical protein
MSDMQTPDMVPLAVPTNGDVFWDSGKYLIQNGVVFAALLFSGSVTDRYHLTMSLVGYAIISIFSLQHMVLFRNGASKDHVMPLAAAGNLILGLGLLGIALVLNLTFGFACLLFLVIRYAYMIWLRSVPVVNLGVLPVEMALKGAAGAAIIQVPLSGWGLVCLFLVGLLISLGKVKNAIIFGSLTSAVIDNYTPKLLNEMMAVVSSSTIMAYCLYTISPDTVQHLGTRNLLFTVPFVLYGIFRYIWLINMVDLKGEVEYYLFKDRAMGLDLAGWIVSLVVILSFR